MTNLDDCDISLMIYGNCKLPITSKKRGRPCAIDRYKTDLIQQKFTNILNSNSSHQTTHLAQNIMPFIVKRQRRQRANNRERTRMQTLNEALIVLRQHLPIDLYLKSKTNSDSQTEIKPHKELNSSVSLKITKIDTLRFAAEYIRLLTDVLRDCEKPETSRACFKNEVSFTSDTSNNSESNVSESSGISFDYNAIKSNESFAAGFNSNYYQPYYYYHNHHHHHQTGFYNSINQAAIYNF